MPSVQDHVVAIVRLPAEGPPSAALELVGTAFFLDGDGTFLTASSSFSEPKPGTRLGLAVRLADRRAPVSLVPIVAHEFADPPWEIAIGRAEVATQSPFTWAGRSAASVLWERVHAYGCVAWEPADGTLHARAAYRSCEGNVLEERAAERGLQAPELHLCFGIPAHYRGAPLFVHERPRAKLLGICVGNGGLGLLRFPLRSAGTSEVRNDVYGIAQDLREAGTWKPQLLQGRTLRDLL
ncbi:MAG: hypothetical protein JNM84_02910 [Planctomycetes bacterium]|nr:hypothetical protein [Planctomycetota bacterium]